MAQCFKCPDGAVICGNPAPRCDETELFLQADDRNWERTDNENTNLGWFRTIEIDVWDGQLRITVDPTMAGMIAAPKKVRIAYDSERRLFVRFI